MFSGSNALGPTMAKNAKIPRSKGKLITISFRAGDGVPPVDTECRPLLETLPLMLMYAIDMIAVPRNKYSLFKYRNATWPSQLAFSASEMRRFCERSHPLAAPRFQRQGVEI
jgi:hypothetical protein